jgi:hypothetical protein
MHNNDILDKSQLVSVTNAAAYCGISRARFYVILRDGAGPTQLEIDGKPFFDRRVLKEWKKARDARKKRGKAGGADGSLTKG